MSVQRRQSQSGLPYDGRYRDRAGRVGTKTFRTKRDAQAFEADQRTAVRNGVRRDPRLGDRNSSTLPQSGWRRSRQAVVTVGSSGERTTGKSPRHGGG
ncbi:MAG: hypothetical protein QOI95_2874 [Acidimicrobiaceae bacterium]|jgi:hypothetical protein